MSESRLLEVPGLQPLRKELLERAQKYYEQFLEQRSDDHSVRTETAATYYRLANLNKLIDSNEAALAAYQKAFTVYQDLVRTNPEALRYRSDLAIVCDGYGWQLIRAERTDEATRMYQRALTLRESVARAQPSNPRVQNELAKGYFGASIVPSMLGQLTEALEYREKALAINEKLVRAKLTEVDFSTDLGRRFNTPATFRFDMATNLQSIGALHSILGREDAALPFFQRASTTYEELVRESPSNMDYRLILANSLNVVGNRVRRAGRPKEALRHLYQARGIIEPLADENPEVPAFRQILAEVDIELGSCLTNASQPAKARNVLRQAGEIIEQRAHDDPGSLHWQRSRAYLHLVLGRLPAPVMPAGEANQILLKAEDLYKNLVAIPGSTSNGRVYDLYDLACVQSLRSRLIGGITGTLTSNELAAGHRVADQAMKSLQQAVADGYRDLSNLRARLDLDPLRNRTDFQNLLRELEAKPKIPPSGTSTAKTWQ